MGRAARAARAARARPCPPVPLACTTDWGKACNLDSCFLDYPQDAQGFPITCSFADGLKETKFIKTVFDWQNWALVFLSFLFLTFSPLLFGLTYRSSNAPFSLSDQLVTKDNKALAISLAGFIIAVGFILTNSISDFGDVAGPGNWQGSGFQTEATSKRAERSRR